MFSLFVITTDNYANTIYFAGMMAGANTIGSIHL